MRRKPDGERGPEVGDLISGMGRERMALRARKTTVLLTVICSFTCLATALAGFTGYVLPHATGPAIVFLIAGISGFVVSISLAGRPQW